MRPLMPPVQTPDNLFHDGNPLTGELGTIVDAEHLNNEQAAIRDTQSELIAILTAAAMEPASTAGQLLAALNKLYAPFNDTLGALSTLVGGANKLPYFTSANAAALTALSSIGRDIVGKATVADVLTYLGLGELAKTPSFLVSKGSNANGWYEIYSDGFKRVGQAWSTPLSIPTPASGVRVNYPISFTSKLNGLFVTENGNTSNNFEFANPAQIGFTGFNMVTMEVTPSSSPITSYGSSFTGFYVAEGY